VYTLNINSIIIMADTISYQYRLMLNRNLLELRRNLDESIGTEEFVDEAHSKGVKAPAFDHTFEPLKPVKPFKLRELTDINFQADKNIKEIEYSISTNKKNLNSAAKKIENGIIYNKSDKKLYSINDNKKTVIAINKSGEHLTHKHFGDNMNHFEINTNNNTIDNSTTASKGQAQKIKAFEKRILALETKIESLKGDKGDKGDTGDTGIQGLQGERGPKGEPGSSSVDTDIITGISSRISRLENAVVLNQKRPSSSPNNNNINYYLNRNYEDTQSIYTELSGIYGRLAASEESISSTYNTDSNLDLLSLITALTGRVEALEA